MANPHPVRWFDASRFAHLRAGRRLAQTAVAAYLGVAQATVSRWERGIRQPTRAQGAALAELLGVDTLER